MKSPFVFVLAFLCSISIGNQIIWGQHSDDLIKKFHNSNVSWELLPTAEVFPKIPDRLLASYKSLSRDQKEKLKNHSDCYAFEYLAGAMQSKSIGQLPSFNILKSPTEIKSAFGALTVHIQFTKEQGKLRKEIRYSKPFKNSLPCLGGVFAYAGGEEFEKISFSKKVAQLKREYRIEDASMVKAGSAKLKTVSANMWNFGVVVEKKSRSDVLAIGLSAIEKDNFKKKYIEYLPIVHIALSNELFPRKQVSFHHEGVTIVLNGLTILAEYDFKKRNWQIAYPELKKELPNIIRFWEMMSEQNVPTKDSSIKNQP